MDKDHIKTLERKKKRVFRIRKRVSGTQSKPRMCINKTNRQLFVQIIDDENGNTLLSGSTLGKEIKSSNLKGCNKNSAKALGELLAGMCNEKGIKQVVLDRRGNKYHGQIAEIADAIRNKGIHV